MCAVHNEMSPFMLSTSLSPALLRNLYTRMLLTRLVDEGILRLHSNGYGDFVTSCRGHEAVQVGTAMCIEVGKDFTLPYYRDLGVVLTIGMTPFEVFHTYLMQAQREPERPPLQSAVSQARHTLPHWGYHKHNTVMGPAPVATQILHAAGIAFASKLRKAPVVTVAYCGDGATSEPDFSEGIRFAAQHQLPAIFICEQDCSSMTANNALAPSCLHNMTLPPGLTHRRIDGRDIATVYTTMQEAMHRVRNGQGPMLLEMYVTRPKPEQPEYDPLIVCQQLLQEQGAWDETWATALYARLSEEVTSAMHNALENILPASQEGK
jgi:2-oxoisovalerate dehydrogenase E1 component alpha subunit